MATKSEQFGGSQILNRSHKNGSRLSPSVAMRCWTFVSVSPIKCCVWHIVHLGHCPSLAVPDRSARAPSMKIHWTSETNGSLPFHALFWSSVVSVRLGPLRAPRLAPQIACAPQYGISVGCVGLGHQQVFQSPSRPPHANSAKKSKRKVTRVPTRTGR